MLGAVLDRFGRPGGEQEDLGGSSGDHGESLDRARLTSCQPGAGVSIDRIGRYAGVAWPATPSSARQRRGGSTGCPSHGPTRPGPGTGQDQAAPPRRGKPRVPGPRDGSVPGTGPAGSRPIHRPVWVAGAGMAVAPAERDPAAEPARSRSRADDRTEPDGSRAGRAARRTSSQASTGSRPARQSVRGPITLTGRGRDRGHARAVLGQPAGGELAPVGRAGRCQLRDRQRGRGLVHQAAGPAGGRGEPAVALLLRAGLRQGPHRAGQPRSSRRWRAPR